MDNPVIQIDKLSKQYRIGTKQERYKTLRDTVTDAFSAPFRRMGQLLQGNGKDMSDSPRTIWALREVSLEVKQGEIVGIIGHNGSGKTTLLKILSRITRPTDGQAIVRGRVGALLEVGTGFHPELTGRENVYLSGAVLGMRRSEIDQKFDAIVEFAGVEAFIDTPVKRYSSGMYVRLAFAVAAHLETEILLVDEVLAVGDAAFQKKCLGKIGDVTRAGRTVLFVSHNMAAVESLCQRGVVLEQGEMQFIGSQTEAIAYYMQSLENSTRSIDLRDRKDRGGTGDVQIVKIEIRDVDGNPLEFVASGQDVDIYFHFETRPSFKGGAAHVGFTCYTHMGVPVFTQSTRVSHIPFQTIPDFGAFVCRIRQLPLPPSSYQFACNIKINDTYSDSLRNAVELTVIEGDFFNTGKIYPPNQGTCLVRGEWRLMD